MTHPKINPVKVEDFKTMVINTKEELAELNEKSNIIARFLAEGQIDFKFSLFGEGDYGLEHIYTIELDDNKTKLHIITNTQGRIYFEVSKEKKVKAGGLRLYDKNNRNSKLLNTH